MKPDACVRGCVVLRRFAIARCYLREHAVEQPPFLVPLLQIDTHTRTRTLTRTSFLSKVDTDRSGALNEAELGAALAIVQRECGALFQALSKDDIAQVRLPGRQPASQLVTAR